MAPGAKLDDGRFDLVSVPQMSFLGGVGLLYHLGTDTFDQVRTVTRFSGSEFVIERAKPGWIHTDGEPRATTARLEVTLKPKSLRIMVPVSSDLSAIDRCATAEAPAQADAPPNRQ